jgi:hypothetical protein
LKTSRRRLIPLQTKIRFQAFGKTKPPTDRAKKRRLEKGQRAAQGMDGKEQKEKINRQQSQLIEDAINKTTSEKHGCVFKMRELVAGPTAISSHSERPKDGAFCCCN